VLPFYSNRADNCSLFLSFASVSTTVISLIVQWYVREGKEIVVREKMCNCIELAKIYACFTKIIIYRKKAYIYPRAL
jgi:hypothetical protein